MGCVYECGNVQLAPLSREILYANLPRYYSWMQSQVVTRYNSHGLFVKGKKELDAWIENVETGKDNVTFAIYYKQEWVGVCSLQAINWINRSAEIAIYVGETSAWGKGVATMAVRFLMEHAFLRLGVVRVWSGTAAKNTGMNRIFVKLGFTQEGIFRCGMFLNGAFEDINSYGILNTEWFRLREGV